MKLTYKTLIAGKERVEVAVDEEGNLWIEAKWMPYLLALTCELFMADFGKEKIVYCRASQFLGHSGLEKRDLNRLAYLAKANPVFAFDGQAAWC